MKCLTVDTPATSYEIHLLNPKEHMAGFGGSRSGLVVGKTASIVLRTRQKKGGMVKDMELDITDKNFWSLIASLMNDATGDVTASTVSEQDKEVA